MCYTCTYSLCKGCIKQGKFFGVRGNKGFCDTCFGTILLIESKDEDRAKVNVDFDDKNSWEYLFKLYWLDLKGKYSLTLEELVNAKSCWTVRSTSARREKEESSDDLYDANDDIDASSDGLLRKRKRNGSSGRRGRKQQKKGAITTREHEISIKGAENLPKTVPHEGMTFLGDTQWASSELLEFIGHMRNGDISYISQFDVQVLLLEYIKQNNLRDPRRKSQIICDMRLSSLFRKPRVGHFEMLKLLEMHFHSKETVNGDSQKATDVDSAQINSGEYNDMSSKICSDKRRKIHKKIERDSPANLEDYAAIDMHNINLIYLRRSLLEDLIDDNGTFSDKITGAFVRIRTSGVGQKQDMYRLVKVLGTHKVAERYSVGKKTTDHALEILNLDKKEVITMDTISNQDFTQEECKRLRQSMKCGLITRLKVGDIREKAKIFQQLRVNDWLENEKQRLSHLRDRASETGRRKELRECVEKLQLLSTPEERARMINEDPEVHVDPCMDPNYESEEELELNKTVDQTSRNGSDLLFHHHGRTGTETNSLQNHTQNCFATNRRSTISPPTEGVTHRQGEGDMEPEKVWHYKDPSGSVQGPFTLLQLSKWAAYFPRDLRIWLTFESEQNSLLLTEVLSKQKDFIQSSSEVDNNKSTGEGGGQDKVNSSLTGNNSPSPIGYNLIFSSQLPSPSADCSAPSREGPNLPGGTLPFTTSWKTQKDAQMLHGQAQHQGNYSCAIPSSAVSYRPAGSHDEWPPGGNIGEWNNSQDSGGGMWSPTKPHMSQSNSEHHSDRRIMKPLQNDSESNSLGGSAENLNSQMDSGSQKIQSPTQQSERDLATSVGTSRQPEFKTCQQEGSCWNSSEDPITPDGLQLSLASAKPESCSTVNPIEDGDSSLASRVAKQSGAPVYSPQSAPAISNLNKGEENMNLGKSNEPEASNKSCERDASNAPVNQPHKTESNPVLSPDTQDFEHTHPSPTPEHDTKNPLKDQSRSTSVAPEELATKARRQSSIAFISETSGPPSGKFVGMQPPKNTPFLVERDKKDGVQPKENKLLREQPKEESTTFKRENIAVNPISDTEAIVAGVLESLTETYNLHEETPLENLTSNSAEEEQPQCSSPIALSPWGEPSYYQGEAVDSALWGVQDDQSNDMWSLSSPTPTLQPSGLGADVKDSCVIEEVIVAQGCNAVEPSPAPVEKKIEKVSSASIHSGVPEQVKSKPTATSSPEGSTKSSGLPPSSTSLEGGADPSGLPPSGASLEWTTKVSGVQSSGSSLEGSKKAFVRQPSGSSLEGDTKASGRQPSGSSVDKKPSDRQPSGASQEGNTKPSAWEPSVPSLEGGTRASGWKKPSISIDGNTKALGWQRSSPSPDASRKASAWQSSGSSPLAGSTKASGWQSSPRESSKPKPSSTWGASQSRNSSSAHQSTTPAGKHSSETPRRQGEAPGNKSWHSSPGNASGRGSHSSHHHDRHSQGSEPWRGSSNHSRRSDHRQDYGGGGGSSRSSSSRGQSQKGICRFYENGYCRKGSSCQYLHR
ncbi:zinc finger CCCH domain-containing protein 19-like isoform X2 [Oryza brachyantha]|uniref:C3H1-type domain-containing protein n=2 Tax=Oryza brachyantha TaxID=4533 RepID=J3N419_ORYBR|nr:zinc finger CCCH domain-containing protein 19-like isoform X2 [Oryza brachyantha]